MLEPHGYGEKFWPENQSKVYKGSWVHGKMHGKGELTISKGDMYIGHFSDGYPHGGGIRKW